jgi:hypothetical protein
MQEIDKKGLWEERRGKKLSSVDPYKMDMVLREEDENYEPLSCLNR